MCDADDLLLSYYLWTFKAGSLASRIAFVQIVKDFMIFGFDTMCDRIALRRYAASVSDNEVDGLSIVIQYIIPEPALNEIMICIGGPQLSFREIVGRWYCKFRSL